MSKWWHYPAWRRRALQAVMWALLGAMLGTAAIVSAHRLAIKDAHYSTPVPCGAFAVRVPADWKVVTRTTSDLKVDANDNSRAKRSRVGRRLSFYQKAVPPGTPIPEFLEQEQLLEVGQLSTEEDDTSHVDAVPIAGYDGVMYVRMYTTMVIYPKSEYIAAVVTPEGQALAVKLAVDGPARETDLTLFRDVLARISRPGQ